MQERTIMNQEKLKQDYDCFSWAINLLLNGQKCSIVSSYKNHQYSGVKLWTFRIFNIYIIGMHTVRYLYLIIADLGALNVRPAYCEIRMVSDVQSSRKRRNSTSPTCSDVIGCQGPLTVSVLTSVQAGRITSWSRVDS